MVVTFGRQTRCTCCFKLHKSAGLWPLRQRIQPRGCHRLKLGTRVTARAFLDSEADNTSTASEQALDRAAQQGGLSRRQPDEDCPKLNFQATDTAGKQEVRRSPLSHTPSKQAQTLLEAWEPLARKLRERKLPGRKKVKRELTDAKLRERKLGGRKKSKRELTDADCDQFSTFLLEFIERKDKLHGDTLSTAFHRLAVMRAHRRSSTPKAMQAFKQLLSQVDGSIKVLSSRSISMIVYSIAKISFLEKLKLPRVATQKPLEEDSTQKDPESSPKSGTTSEDPTAIPGTHSQAGADERAEKSAGGEQASRNLDNTAAMAETELPVVQVADAIDDSRQSSLSTPLDTTPELDRSEQISNDSQKPVVNLSEQIGDDAQNATGFPPEREGQTSERRESNAQTESRRPGQVLAKPVRRPLMWNPQRELPADTHVILDSLANAWLSKKKEATVQGLVNLMWGFARLGFNPLEGSLFQQAQDKVLQLCPKMKGQDVDNLLWAYGQLEQPMREDLLEALTQKILQLVEDGKLQVLSIPVILQACAKLKKSPADGRLFEVLLGVLVEGSGAQNLKRLTPGFMTATLAAAASVGHPVTEDFVEKWAQQCKRRILEYKIWEAEAIVWACQQLNIDPLNGALMESLFREQPGLQGLISMRLEADSEDLAW